MGNCFCDKLRTEKEIQAIVSDNIAVNSERFNSPAPSTRRRHERNPSNSYDKFRKDSFQAIQEGKVYLAKLRNILNESKQLALQIKRLRGEESLPED